MANEFEPPVILVKSTGGAGLGDSIRALLSALHYAKVTGRRITVCWDDGLYGEKGVDVFPRLLQLVDIPAADLNELDQVNVHPPAWRNQLGTPLNALYGRLRDDDWNRAWALANLTFDQRRFDYAEPVLVMWDFDGFAGSWAAAGPARRMGATPDQALRIMAKQHLRPAPVVQVEVRRIRGEEFCQHMVGVHVRKTFEKGGASRHLDLAAVFSVVDGLLAGNDDTGIFLATDNSEVESAFRARYPRVVTSRKRFGTPGVALHFDEAVSDKTQGAIEALVDLSLLAACDVLIQPASSSFSRVATILGNIPSMGVFALPPGKPTLRQRLRLFWKIRNVRRSIT